MTRTCSMNRRYPRTSRLLINGPITAKKSLSCPSPTYVRRHERIPDWAKGTYAFGGRTRLWSPQTCVVDQTGERARSP